LAGREKRGALIHIIAEFMASAFQRAQYKAQS